MARREPHARTSALEWASAALGLAVLLLVFGVIGADLRRGGATPPAITVEVREVAASGQGFVVVFEAINRGGTAASVEIEGTLSVPGKPSETASATLDYVAAGARVEGGLMFAQDPRQGRLRLRALGYQDP
ncbi:uncharacterized protein (TIGR02588 family) [Sphingomonas kyeonggiensis]|uniref:hypothetical protein n=1 Tax=Sphingomonas kyeonggiensis TaxID=1268553 RepID=UPI002783AC81|nr:hypothetical protein [Sphingomonas kyeonggiensis]MDQ0249530.1 uncharacterized protein (TIGR02588 family) [Sphingomonas kyeonggiensis]